ncbi:hypothetical protein GOV12_03985 [Candidatus Pacearchaeota archaeon]|nr:hypothetical protein [Candidatus Pacearchaeota archaeon]
MKKTQISSKFVKMHFLLADAMRDTCRMHRFLGQEELQQTYERYLDAFLETNESQLDIEIGKKDKVRLRRYNEHDWYEKQIEFGYIGNCPEMKGLDIRLTNGNLIENARKIRLELINPKNTPLPNEFKTQLQDMLTQTKWIFPRFPLILLPGNTIRGEHNKWARHEKKPDFWMCSRTKYDLDAGNSRSISYTLNGYYRANCFVGKK